MPQTSDAQPEILAHVTTPQGLAFQLRRDPRGTLDVPAFDNVFVSIHIGRPTKLGCLRDGRRHLGTAVHGDIDIIPPNTPSRWQMHDHNDMALLLSLPPSLLRTVAEASGLDPARIEIRNRFQVRDTELEALSWAMKREMESNYPSGRFYLDGLALALASRLVACHSSIARPPAQRSEGLSGHRLKQVLSYIEDQLSEDLSLDQIAAVSGISASHIRTLFRAAMGVPIHQYIIGRRVERARSLLLHDPRPIAQVALDSGFSHQSHMARHMRRILGLAPSAIRRLHPAPGD